MQPEQCCHKKRALGHTWGPQGPHRWGWGHRRRGSVQPQEEPGGVLLRTVGRQLWCPGCLTRVTRPGQGGATHHATHPPRTVQFQGPHVFLGIWGHCLSPSGSSVPSGTLCLELCPLCPHPAPHPHWSTTDLPSGSGFVHPDIPHNRKHTAVALVTSCPQHRVCRVRRPGLVGASPACGPVAFRWGTVHTLPPTGGCAVPLGLLGAAPWLACAAFVGPGAFASPGYLAGVGPGPVGAQFTGEGFVLQRGREGPWQSFSQSPGGSDPETK